MSQRKILIINTIIFALASFAHIPVIVLSLIGKVSLEQSNFFFIFALACLDIALIISCITAFLIERLRQNIITAHSIVIALMATFSAVSIAKVILFGVPEGSYHFSIGTTTALCAYAVYLVRRTYIEYKGGVMGSYHWYAAGVVGIGEAAMFSKLLSTTFGT